MAVLAAKAFFNIAIKHLTAFFAKGWSDSRKFITTVAAQGTPPRERTLAKFTDSRIKKIENPG
ncbi:MAG: hypothetical protein ABF391_16700 [Akkermansiaceae bacterium]|jgi:hypothetical protein